MRFMNYDHLTLQMIIKSELSEHWDEIPPSTRAVMLGVVVALQNLLAPGAPLAEAIREYASRIKPKGGGRPEGSIEVKTEYLLKLFTEMPDAKPAAIVDEIFQRTQAGDDECPFVLDDASDDRLIEDATSKTLDRAEITAAVYRAKYLSKKSSKNS